MLLLLGRSVRRLVRAFEGLVPPYSTTAVNTVGQQRVHRHWSSITQEPWDWPQILGANLEQETYRLVQA